MATYFSESESAKAVNARISPDCDPRLRQVMESLVEHLHAFAKDVELTQDEWGVAVDFLTKTGQICSEERQEVILLSDVLGFSMLVDAINTRRPANATENTVLGPFYLPEAPVRQANETISLDGIGEECRFYGTVKTVDGSPIENACLEVWSDSEDGFYDVQQPDKQPKWNNRGRFFTDADGVYDFRGIKPTSYPIPHDGTVGKMLAALGRNPYRPAHMHFIVSAPGHETVVTHTFVNGDQYLGDDVVFGVKEGLIVDYTKCEKTGVWQQHYDFVMVPSD